MVVEDDDWLRSAYRALLEENNWNVVTAKSRELLPDGVELADLVVPARALPGKKYPSFVDAADWASAELTPHGVRVGFVSSPREADLIETPNCIFRPDFALEQVVRWDELLAAIKQALRSARRTVRGPGRGKSSE